MKKVLQYLFEHKTLSRANAKKVLMDVSAGIYNEQEVTAFITVFLMRSITLEELQGFRDALLELKVNVSVPQLNTIDIVGTGGDGAHTFNISTTAMFVAAGAGAKVAKHGNRSVSSKSGAADALEALGVHINLQAPEVAQSLDTCGIGFMFAPNHHPAMKNVAAVRKEMGVRTIFNILGPLTNPANAPHMLMGVFHKDLVGIQVRALQRLGMKHALVVYGLEGLDEISLEGPTLIGELKDGEVSEYEIHPRDFGLSTKTTDTFKVNDPKESIAILRSVLDDKAGPAHDIVCLNAGAALYAADIASSIGEGILMAQQSINSGRAREKLVQFIQTTQSLAKA